MGAQAVLAWLGLAGCVVSIVSYVSDRLTDGDAFEQHRWQVVEACRQMRRETEYLEGVLRRCM